MSVFVFACLSTVCLPASVSPELHTLSSPLFNTCYVTYSRLHLQCFDAVGWAAGRASGL